VSTVPRMSAHPLCTNAVVSSSSQAKVGGS
jgi:hypothetical protein